MGPCTMTLLMVHTLLCFCGLVSINWSLSVMAEFMLFSFLTWENNRIWNSSTSGRPIYVLYSKLIPRTYSQLWLTVFCHTSLIQSPSYYQVLIFINEQFILSWSFVPLFINILAFEISTLAQGFTLYLKMNTSMGQQNIKDLFNLFCHLSQTTIQNFTLQLGYKMLAEEYFTQYYTSFPTKHGSEIVMGHGLCTTMWDQ